MATDFQLPTAIAQVPNTIGQLPHMKSLPGCHVSFPGHEPNPLAHLCRSMVAGQQGNLHP